LNNVSVNVADAILLRSFSGLSSFFPRSITVPRIHGCLKSETGMLPQIKAIESCPWAHEKFGRVFTFSLSLSLLANKCTLIRARFLFKNDVSLNTRRSQNRAQRNQRATRTALSEYSDFRKSLTIFLFLLRFKLLKSRVR